MLVMKSVQDLTKFFIIKIDNHFNPLIKKKLKIKKKERNEERNKKIIF